MNKLFVLVILLASFAAQASYSVVSTSSTTIGSLTRTETVIQDGSDNRNQFTMTRVRKTTPRTGGPRASILVLPGSAANFEIYENDPNRVYTNSFAGYLASHDYEVWGYSPRSKQFANGACATGNTCDIMAGWGLATVASDAKYIKDQIASIVGGDIVLGGWSLGAISTIATLNAYPSDFDAALIWEGTLFTNDTAVILGNTVNCATAESKLALGQVTDISLLFGGTSTIPALKAIVANTTDPVRHTLLVAGTTTPLTSPPSYATGYTFLRGNGALVPNYKYAYEPIVITALSNSTFNAYESGVIGRDLYCSLAGEDTSFIDNLSAYTNPIYEIKTGHGLGPWMDDNIALFGTSSGDITVDYQSDFAHADHYASASHLTILESPIRTWLDGMYP